MLQRPQDNNVEILDKGEEAPEGFRVVEQFGRMLVVKPKHNCNTCYGRGVQIRNQTPEDCRCVYGRANRFHWAMRRYENALAMASVKKQFAGTSIELVRLLKARENKRKHELRAK